MQSLAKKAAAVAVLTFLLLWAVGLGRVVAKPVPPPTWEPAGREETYSRQQVANNLRALGLAAKALPAVLDHGDIEKVRAHEKTAHLAVTTATFGEDEALVRSAINDHKGTVFHQRNVGLTGHRVLTLEVGVSPERFEDLVKALRGVARLRSISVVQRDRTDDLRRLHAQRQTLKQHLEAVTKLRRAKPASVEDELRIEQKVQDIEKELQSIAVQMGDLLGKESYYHVFLSLTEESPGSSFDRADALPRHLALAALWALPWWLAAMGVLAALPAAWFSVQVLRGKDLPA